MRKRRKLGHQQPTSLQEERAAQLESGADEPVLNKASRSVYESDLYEREAYLATNNGFSLYQTPDRRRLPQAEAGGRA